MLDKFSSLLKESIFYLQKIRKKKIKKLFKQSIIFIRKKWHYINKCPNNWSKNKIQLK